MIYLLFKKFKKPFGSRDCLLPRLKFITMCGAIRSPKYIYAESFIFEIFIYYYFLLYIYFFILLQGKETYFLALVRRTEDI